MKVSLRENKNCSLPNNIQATLMKVRDLVNFVTLAYCQWCFKRSTVVDDLWNDLLLYKTLPYDAINLDDSNSAITLVKRHHLYLIGDVLLLVLFRDFVLQEAARWHSW